MQTQIRDSCVVLGSMLLFGLVFLGLDAILHRFTGRFYGDFILVSVVSAFLAAFATGLGVRRHRRALAVITVTVPVMIFFWFFYAIDCLFEKYDFCTYNITHTPFSPLAVSIEHLKFLFFAVAMGLGGGASAIWVRGLSRSTQEQADPDHGPASAGARPAADSPENHL